MIILVSKLEKKFKKVKNAKSPVGDTGNKTKSENRARAETNWDSL